MQSVGSDAATLLYAYNDNEKHGSYKGPDDPFIGRQPAALEKVENHDSDIINVVNLLF